MVGVGDLHSNGSDLVWKMDRTEKWTKNIVNFHRDRPKTAIVNLQVDVPCTDLALVVGGHKYMSGQWAGGRSSHGLSPPITYIYLPNCYHDIVNLLMTSHPRGYKGACFSQMQENWPLSARTAKNLASRLPRLFWGTLEEALACGVRILLGSPISPAKYSEDPSDSLLQDI